MRESCSLSSGLLSSVWHQRRWVWGGSKHGAQSQLLLGACLCHCCWNIQGPAGGGIYGEPVRVDDKSKGTRGIRKGKRLFSAFSNVCRTRLRTKLIHSLNALGVADEVAEPGWGWLLPHQAEAEGTDGTTGTRAGSGTGTAWDGSSARRCSQEPQGGILSQSSSHMSFFLPLLHSCLWCLRYLAPGMSVEVATFSFPVFSLRKRQCPVLLLGVIPSSREALPLMPA